MDRTTPSPPTTLGYKSRWGQREWICLLTMGGATECSIISLLSNHHMSSLSINPSIIIPISHLPPLPITVSLTASSPPFHCHFPL